MHSADSTSGEHGDERREIFSSESKRSFRTPSPAGSQSNPSQKKKPPRTEVSADETVKPDNETTLIKASASPSPVEPKADDEKNSSTELRSDEPPASLDVSVDEGPL